MDIWFISDTHFFHKNIIEYCDRPFDSVKEMNEALVTNWNECVKPHDLIYHTGDVSFGKAEETSDLLALLNGEKHLIRGNHDKGREKGWRDHWRTVNDFKEIKWADQKIVLCHYALRVWNRSHYGSWHVYGHSHGELDDDPHALSWDVGVDNNDFKPVSFDQLAEIMSQKDFKPVDHHGR